MNELLRYLVAGGVNTVVGYGVFWVGLHQLGLHASAANALGYAVALCVAYVLNRVLVFTASTAGGASVVRFMLAFILAFAINQGVLATCIEFFQLRAEFAQVIAMIIYTLVFYFANKYYVFRRSKPQPTPQSVQK